MADKKTAAYKRRNGFELRKARVAWRKKARYGIETPTVEGPYYRWFLDMQERDRVYALLRRPEHPEAKVHHKCTRSPEGEVKITTTGN